MHEKRQHVPDDGDLCQRVWPHDRVFPSADYTKFPFEDHIDRRRDERWPEEQQKALDDETAPMSHSGACLANVERVMYPTSSTDTKGLSAKTVSNGR